MVSRLTSGAQLRPRQNLCCSLLAEWLDRVHHLREISLDLKISEEGLERVEQTKLLGVHLHELLKWDQHLKQLVWKSCYGSLSVSRKVFAHFNLRKYLAQALVLSKINYCESCILTFTLPDFLLKHLQRLQFAAATFTRGRYVRDFSLLKLVPKVPYMNNWPLALRSNQVTSLCTLRSSSASRLSNPHRSSGTICPVKYPALTLFQILTAMLKHVFLTDKRLICRRVFISFIILFIVLFYFIFFYLYLLVNFYHKSYPFLVFLTYWLTPFQILTAMLKHIFLNKLLISSRVFISFIILFIVLFYFIFFLPFTCL